MIQHLLILRTSLLGPAQIILERFMGPSWKEQNKAAAVSAASHYGDAVSDLVDTAIGTMFDEEMTDSVRDSTLNDDTITLERQEQWRQLVLKLTIPRWKSVLQGDSHVVAVQERYVVTVGKHDLIFMITGTGDDDELGLHTILTVVLAVIRETCGKIEGDKVIKNLGKLCLIIDAMFDENQGSCLSLEVNHIMHQTKLKKPVV